MSNALRARLVLSLVLTACGPGAGAQTPIAEFEQRLEQLRNQARIPAVSVAIAKGQSIVWSKGFGTPDLATRRPTTDTTVFHLASITKPMASTVLLQLVEEGKVSLDDPASKWGITIESPGTIRIRHLLSHTSEGTPGTSFKYSGSRFARLDTVIAQATGMPFVQALQKRIIEKLKLRHTAPNPESPLFALSGKDRATFEGNVARGYTATDTGYVPTTYQKYVGASAGMTASARDVAAFSMAMDRNALLKPETKALAWTPPVSPAGDTLAYGFGWFVTRYKGVRVVWQYGLWTATSTLLLKVPERELTFVILANTDALSAPYQLGAGQLETSPWAREFLDRFVIGSETLPQAR